MGTIPRVRVVLCNNGLKWTDTAQQLVERAGFPGDRSPWNTSTTMKWLAAAGGKAGERHSAIVPGKPLWRYGLLSGSYRQIPVREIEVLFNRHGDLLLERNVRRLLGLQANRVNQG